MLFKMDFEKAYDSISLGFLDYMLAQLGFGSVWILWICSYLHFSTMSILVNECPTNDFIIHKGLNQGDMLSSFLFLMVAEGLAGMVKKAVIEGSLVGFQVNQNISFSLFQYADDSIFVGTSSWDNIWCIKSIFRIFESELPPLFSRAMLSLFLFSFWISRWELI